MNKQELLDSIITLKGEGLGSRKIAKKLGIGKSTVNRYFKEYLQGKGGVEKKPKVLLLDLESAPSVVVAFNRFKVNLTQDHVLREGGWLISYAYKWLGDKIVQGNVLTPIEAIAADDSGLCMELLELIEQADVVVYHNGLNFDLPLLKARMLINGLPPIRKIKSVDTLQLVKEFKLNSNKLNSLGKQLDIGTKLDHEGIGLWIRCMEGDQSALDHMFEYNKVDVDLLEQVYLAVRPYSNRHPNLAIYYQGDKLRCNICGSEHIKPTGNLVTTNVNIFEEYQCEDCHARFKNRKSILNKDQRSNILSN